jgi:hypothetical protein
MEGAPLTNATDSEDHFTPKKPKQKREKYEDLDDDAAALHRRRHIAREALRHEEAQRSLSLEANAPRIASRVLEQRQRAPEATQLHGQQKSPEHIGHMLLTAEADHSTREGLRPSYGPERIQLRPGMHIETLSRAELLELSRQIAVETTSLRDVYETHLIGEQALRRIIAEYLQGGDIHHILQREILEHEIDFERDPALRDASAVTNYDHHENSQVIAPGKDALNQLLQKAQAVIGMSDDDENLSYDRAHRSGEQHTASPPRLKRGPVDYVMAIIIVMLIILVLVLLFGHK